MSALRPQISVIDTLGTAAVQSPWQIDSFQGTARHTSGLVVRWRVDTQGAAPALDISGLPKLKNTQWANQLEKLVQEAIFLLS